MLSSDLLFIFQWWLVLFLIGFIFVPLTANIFLNFIDRGYIFAKVLGMVLVSYVVFILGTLKVLPFTETAIYLVLAVFLVVNLFLVRVRPLLGSRLVSSRKVFIFEELLFLAALAFWAYIRSHEPSIHGLEKYMDFGFVNSILRADFFPPKDMWYPPEAINYYYFGHLATAVLTKLSGIDSAITYNLMIATLFALTFTGAFSIGMNLFSTITKTPPRSHSVTPRGWPNGLPRGGLLAGLLTAFLVSLAGNLHTIYTFFKPYNTENPVPFWQLLFSPETFPNTYWYPNATRFIENTIHEFPIYSFVVSDLHGHVLDIPVVLMTIALLLSIISKHEARNPKQYQNANYKNSKRFEHSNLFRISNFAREAPPFRILLLAFLLAVMYMTNVWDALIYALLTFLVFAYLAYQSKKYLLLATCYLLLIATAIIITLPFSLNFKPFVSGIGVICAPEFLTTIGKLGPFLFEPNHCQRSPFWQLMILYGFFYLFVVWFLVSILRKLNARRLSLHSTDIFILILILLSTILILVPEFFYAKDIYPAHYRANTMFKLVYQAFIMLSIASAYIAIHFISKIKDQRSKIQIKNKIFNFYYVFLLFTILFFILVIVYPYFAINPYYSDLQTYHGLNGTQYLKRLYPQDYEAILWLNKNIKGQPVILEANGESYTDYGRVSSNTGLPTVIGWPVHEWLWRGSYDVAAPRITDVKTLYETTDIQTAKRLVSKYNIELVFVGDLERQKYPSLNELKFEQLGKVIFQQEQTRIYQIIR